MRRSSAAILGVLVGMVTGAAFFRRATLRRERVDLYYEDGSMVSLGDGAPDAARLLPLAREFVRAARA
jgi:hypothetical protein